MGPDGTALAQAAHACFACKKLKRRCDKQLPQCSLCLRIGRDCGYNDTTTLPTGDSRALQNQVDELEALLLQKNRQIEELSSLLSESTHSHDMSTPAIYPGAVERFPAMFFLDHEIFREARPAIPQPQLPISKDVFADLMDLDHLGYLSDLFFDTIHTWFPIISRRRFELLLTEPGFKPSPDIALLIAAMHLLVHEDFKCCANTSSDIYCTVKNYAATLEVNALMTPQVLQSKVLIALYEIGHSIYPAAYLSVGSCAAFGKALGLDNRKDSPQMLRKSGSWTQDEELRRLWWAILLLDR